ncbi:ATP-binding protein [Candidatus Uhrbacteria bacterium]|nr:ATP-binding protein [Candidatus Uhrbacteria bacterium]
MANETRVNLRRLLEDIRDAYSSPVEEVIITELIANSLDSGACEIRFDLESADKTLRCVDNGSGMKRQQLKDYHNIAASTKDRGFGIGFAGIGAKLSLLVSEKVITETKGPRGSRAATEWHLASPTRAPWKFIPSADLIPFPKGTAVGIVLSNENSRLLDVDFIRQTIEKHFCPLLDQELMKNFLRYVYPRGVEFFVSGEKMPAVPPLSRNQTFFKVFVGKRSRRPVGYGYLISDMTAHPSSDSGAPSGAASGAISSGTAPLEGMVIATYGKVIKKGWEWLGVMPKSFQKMRGLVELPGLAEILTTNKSDFLSDANSLKKYYRYRKAIQESVLEILAGMGESSFSKPADLSKQIKGFSKKIEQTLDGLITDFPELGSLVGVKHRQAEVPAAIPAEGAADMEAEAALAEAGTLAPVSAIVPQREEYLTGTPEADQPCTLSSMPAEADTAEPGDEVVGTKIRI